MIEVADIVAAARSYLGTPYVHQGRLPGIGMDCIGLVVCVAREVGSFGRDQIRYTHQTAGAAMLGEMQQAFGDSIQGEAKPGDVLVYWTGRGRKPQHVAILTADDTVIHVLTGGVVAEIPRGGWRSRELLAYRFPGVE